MATASARGARRLAPWLAWVAAALMLHAWGCGTGASATDDPAASEEHHERTSGALARIEAGDGGAAIDSGVTDANASGEAGTGGACTKDSDCIATDYCATDGTCQPQKTTGAACQVTAGGDCRQIGCRECASDFCDDGICCGTSSCPGCQTCAAAMQQPFADGGTPGNGTCAPSVAGTNYPAGFCAGSAPDSCLAQPFCDGKGACVAFAPAGTACGQPSCTGAAVTTPVCSGAGTCRSANLTCAPYACENGACATSCATAADCTPPAKCNLGSCGGAEPNGTTCSSGAECGSGFCIDGVCCNQACPAQCQACDTPGNVGTCAPVTGAPHVSHTPCAGSEDGGSACTGTCDGVNVSACQYPGAGVVCNAACNGFTLSSGICDGTGGCGGMRNAACQEHFACQGPLACNTSCQVSTDCAPGYACLGGSCVTTSGTCVGNTSVVTVNGEDGGVVPCGVYACQPDAGLCAIACTTASDCAPGAICGSGGQCGTSSGGGCSCEAVGAQQRSTHAWLLALALGAIAFGRAQRRRV